MPAWSPRQQIVPLAGGVGEVTTDGMSCSPLRASTRSLGRWFSHPAAKRGLVSHAGEEHGIAVVGDDWPEQQS